MRDGAAGAEGGGDERGFGQLLVGGAGFSARFEWISMQ